MNKDEAKKILEKQGYRTIGKNSAIKICNWTRKSLRDEGVCYKQQFYNIKSHLCAQISCSLFNCQNKCIHCFSRIFLASSLFIFNIIFDLFNYIYLPVIIKISIY